MKNIVQIVVVAVTVLREQKTHVSSIDTKSLKYSGNNKIAIIALCPYALL